MFFRKIKNWTTTRNTYIALTANNAIEFRLCDRGTCDFVESCKIIAPAGVYFTNRWIFVVASYSRTNGTSELLIDGKYRCSNSPGWRPITSYSTIRLGGPTFGQFYGRMACVSMYDIALRYDEVDKVNASCAAVLQYYYNQCKEEIIDL